MWGSSSPPAGPGPGPRRPDAVGADPGLPVLPRRGEEAGFTVVRAAVVAVVVIGAGRLAHLPQDRAWTLLAVGAVWALVPAARPVTALGAVAVTWLLGDGFLTNRLGELSFGTRDRADLAVLVLAAAVALLISRRASNRNRSSAEDRTRKG